MAQYVALLRGINVGGRIIKMAELRVCFEKMGCREVKTVLQSGNVIFETDTRHARLKPQVEKALAGTFHYPAKVQVVVLGQLREIVAASPYADNDPDFHAYVIFMENGLEEDLAAETVQFVPGEKVRVGNGVVYWRCPRGSTLQGSFGRLLAKATYRDFNTNRNLRTLRKIITT